MNLRLRSYTLDDEEKWDSFCAKSYHATFLHSRAFLSYHGNKFQDQSLIIESEDSWLAVFPAATHLMDPGVLVSHPGATYGGFISAKGFQGELLLSGLRSTCKWYSDRGFNKIIYKAVPFFYQSRLAQDDRYALFRVGAQLESCGLSSTIDLSNKPLLNQRRRRNLKKANESGVEICEGIHYLSKFWPILIENLKRKYKVAPVHSIEEITFLAKLFPENIVCLVGYQNNITVAGIVIFSINNTYHAQYIASSEIGYKVSALDLLFDYAIKKAIKMGKKWFDFGVSTENGGQNLNAGLYNFKCEIGGGGTVYESYKIELSKKIHS